MSQQQWGRQPKKPMYGPGSGRTANAGKDPFAVMEITGDLVAALGVLGVVMGILIAVDGGPEATVIVSGSAALATLGLILVALCKIGTGLWKAGHLK